MLADAEFRNEGLALKLDMTPVDGAAVQALVHRAQATPADVIERYKRITSEAN